MIHMRETLENNASIARLNDIIFEIENLLNSLSIANSNEIENLQIFFKYRDSTPDTAD